MDSPVKTTLDVTISAGGLSSPIWLPKVLALAQVGIGAFMLVGGAVLLGMRLIITWRELRRSERDGE